MVTQKKPEASIIEIIQKMIKEGETEETIVQTLKDLGVEPQKARKLLLLGEADTFALLRGDISKIVNAGIEKEKIGLKGFLSEEIKKNAQETEKHVLSTVIADLQQYEKDIENQRNSFRAKINENMDRVSFLSDRVKDKLNELGTAVRQIQVDMDEVKVRGVASRNKLISTVLLIVGIAFAISDLWLLIQSFQTSFTSVDSLIIMVLIALISITMLFVSTLI